MPFPSFWSYFVGVAFIGTAISLFSGVLTKLSCTLLAVLVFTWVLVLHAPRMFASPAIEPDWTSLFVALAMAVIAVQALHLCIKKPVAETTSKSGNISVRHEKLGSISF